jgi:uncharacterized lipoprotein YddW (UPF0748 family)
VADDIVSRYDIDGFHIDDYFYPTCSGRAGHPDHGGISPRCPWVFVTLHCATGVADNVNVFVKQLSETIHQRKPWGEIRHLALRHLPQPEERPANGSATNGLQNYDDLYADVRCG